MATAKARTSVSLPLIYSSRGSLTSSVLAVERCRMADGERQSCVLKVQIIDVASVRRVMLTF